jgi:hypothetical protein
VVGQCELVGAALTLTGLRSLCHCVIFVLAASPIPHVGVGRKSKAKKRNSFERLVKVLCKLLIGNDGSANGNRTRVLRLRIT